MKLNCVTPWFNILDYGKVIDKHVAKFENLILKTVEMTGHQKMRKWFRPSSNSIQLTLKIRKKIFFSNGHNFLGYAY